MVLAHVNQLSCTFHSGKCGFSYSFGRTCEGHYGAVCRLTRVHIQDLDTGFLAICLITAFDDCSYYCIDYILVAAFAEIGHAFYYLFHSYLRINVVLKIL